MRYYLGIDPGLSGALALYDPVANELIVEDMPTYIITVNRKKKRVIDMYKLAGFIDNHRSDIIMAAAEEVNAMPKQGVTSCFNFGYATAAAHMAVSAYFIRLERVRPAVWKKAMGVGKDKDMCRRHASTLLPNHAHNWPLKKHDGRAEAALIAIYAYRNFSEQNTVSSLI